jgi:YggT family protein
MDQIIFILVTFIDYLASAINLLLLAYVVLSFFMDPYHRVRMTVNQLVDPILNPIRRLLPQTSSLDFSPLIAFGAVWILEFVLKQILFSLAG